MKAKTRTLTGLALLAGVMLAAGIVWAQATKTPVTGDVTITWLGESEKVWVDEEGSLHWRRQPGTFMIDGDVSGTGSFLANGNRNSDTSEGDGWGTEILELSLGDLSGTFEGRYSESWTNWELVGQFVGDGTGDFAGMKALISYTGVYGSIFREYDGIILDPQGE